MHAALQQWNFLCLTDHAITAFFCTIHASSSHNVSTVPCQKYLSTKLHSLLKPCVAASRAVRVFVFRRSQLLLHSLPFFNLPFICAHCTMLAQPIQQQHDTMVSGQIHLLCRPRATVSSVQQQSSYRAHLHALVCILVLSALLFPAACCSLAGVSCVSHGTGRLCAFRCSRL